MGWKREQAFCHTGISGGNMSWCISSQSGFKLTGRGSSSSTVPFCTDSSAPASLWWWWWCFFFFFFSLSSFSFFCFFFLCLEDFFSRTCRNKRMIHYTYLYIYIKNFWSGVETLMKWNKNSLRYVTERDLRKRAANVLHTDRSMWTGVSSTAAGFGTLTWSVVTHGLFCLSFFGLIRLRVWRRAGHRVCQRGCFGCYCCCFLFSHTNARTHTHRRMSHQNMHT